MTGTWLIVRKDGKKFGLPFLLNIAELARLANDPDHEYIVSNVVMMRRVKIGKGKGLLALHRVEGN